MPYYDNNLDDLLAFDGIRSFLGGQASGLQSDLLAENQVQQLQNMTLSPKGNLETRVGTTNFCTTATSAVGSVGGMRYYETAANEQLLTVTTEGSLALIQMALPPCTQLMLLGAN